MAQLFAMLAEMSNKMDAHTQAFINDARALRGEMRQVGRGLQAGTAKIMAIARSEARTTVCKMATPRAATNELGGSATAVRPAVAAGEDRVMRETCWARRVEVTETVTQREKLTG